MNNNNRKVILVQIALLTLFLFQIYSFSKLKSDSSEYIIKKHERNREDIIENGLTGSQASAISSAITDANLMVQSNVESYALMSAYFTTISCILAVSTFYSTGKKDKV